MTRRPSPALLALVLVLLLACSGTSYAVGRAQSGDSLISLKSLSGNRLRTDTVTGVQVKESTLGTVPRASRATRADTVAGVARRPLALEEGWDAGSDQNNPPTYGKDAQGWVRLEGAVERLGSGSTGIGTLPVGYRPAGFVYVTVYTLNGEPGTVWIAPTGAIVFVSGAPQFVSLENITFRPTS